MQRRYYGVQGRFEPARTGEIDPARQRQFRITAGRRCEYCRMPEWALLAGCEVDHIISRKHGGITDLSNLAFSCARRALMLAPSLGPRVRSSGSSIRPAE